MLLGDNSLETVGELTYGLLETPAYDRLAQYLNRDPACAALIRDRYIPPAHDLDALLTLPADSLGYIYAAQMKKTGFDPNLHAGMTEVSQKGLLLLSKGLLPSGLGLFHLFSRLLEQGFLPGFYVRRDLGK